MKKVILLGIFLFLFLLSPKIIFAEEINNFTSNITVNRNGTVDVSETIIYDFGSLERHGIFRTLPTVKTNNAGKKFRLEYVKFSVSDNLNKKYSYKKSEENDEITLKIGDPNRTVSGVHVYKIFYSVAGALSYFSDHDELYWNITGNSWTVPINSASATISLADVKDKELKLSCFTGFSGSSDQNCTVRAVNGSAVFQSLKPLSSGEGLTVVLGFPKNIVDVLEPKEIINFFETPLGKIVGVVVAILLALLALGWYVIAPFVIVWKWLKHGRDPIAPLGVTSAWFDAPKTPSKRKLTPGETGALIDETVDMQDISATIVDLARRGYMKIVEEKKNDFSLLKVKDWKNDTALEAFETTLLDGIFGQEDSIRIKDTDLIEAVKDTKEAIYKNLVKDKFFNENPDKIRSLYTVIAGFAFFTANVFLAFVAFIFGRAMPQKTIEGSQAANVAKSLKNFLASQERQLTFQAKNQLFFEKLLPFAVAFGVEKVWAGRFKDINLKPPTWYQGYNQGTFNSYVFVHSLNSSFSSIQSSATPTSSSSGFSSGFSGGSSGGGGGGGGGGSW